MKRLTWLSVLLLSSLVVVRPMRLRRSCKHRHPLFTLPITWTKKINWAGVSTPSGEAGRSNCKHIPANLKAATCNFLIMKKHARSCQWNFKGSAQPFMKHLLPGSPLTCWIAPPHQQPNYSAITLKPLSSSPRANVACVLRPVLRARVLDHSCPVFWNSHPVLQPMPVSNNGLSKAKCRSIKTSEYLQALNQEPS